MAAEGLEKFTEVPVEFFKDGSAFVKKCQKPTKKEYFQIIRAVGVGFVMMGVIGYVVKLLHIPIRYLIV
ncbi:protein transport protein Sss1p [[Candida] anglica]|uniref:Protein transport protein Sss1p n=1 Tax=[Candida] anglica TaxID=148631 RepID=A0ABP0EM37_9ASCO